MSETTTHGRCHCGDIAFRLDGAPQFPFLCHCDNCKKLHGGARLAAATFARANLHVTSGSPATYRYQGGSGQIEAHFCVRCATPLYALPDSLPEIAVVRLNALDDPNAIAPKKSLFRDQACAWDHPL